MAGFTDLPSINLKIGEDWQAFENGNGRIYYINNKTRTAQWIPPPEGWTTESSLPYGWETSIDRAGQPYYIDHVGQATQREEPRDLDILEQPDPRNIQLSRDPKLGFGFVAGSEKPVVVRFVTEGGPSEHKLQPGDEILAINDEDVYNAAREHVINLVRSCPESMMLTVCQPRVNNSSRKSAILTAAKRARLREKPARVRFADTVTINGSPMLVARELDNMPVLPNVIRIYLENGQTRSFKFDDVTTVKDVLDVLQEKLQINLWQHFALTVLDTATGRIGLLQPHQTLAQIAAKPGAHLMRCMLRLAFLPQDGFDMLQKDSAAFEYLYMQCCNDIVEGRFPLKQDIVLRLAALHMHQHALSTKMGKVSVKAIRKACGLERFLPENIMRLAKKRDLTKILGIHLKGYSSLSEVSAKLHYTKLAQEHCNRCFLATLMNEKIEMMMFVGPTCGVATSPDFRTNSMKSIVGFTDIKHITLTRVNKDSETVIHVFTKADLEVRIGMSSEDVMDFISLIEGYYKLQIDANCSTLILPPSPTNNNATEIYETVLPAYKGVHFVIPEPWSYTKDYVSKNFEEVLNGKTIESAVENGENEQILTVDGEKIDMVDGEDSEKEESKPPVVPVSLTTSVDQCRTTMVMDFSHCPPTSETIYEPIDGTDSEAEWKMEAPLASPDPSGSEWSIAVETSQMMEEMDNDEYSDTDDDTPNPSPYKRLNRNSQYRQSFGLYRPQVETQVNGISAEETEAKTEEEALDDSDEIHPHYNPLLFCDGGLYLDPDIIDLTLIPPPETPERDTLADFPVSLPSPPAGFEDSETGANEETPGHYSNVCDNEDHDEGPIYETYASEKPDLPPDLADLPCSIREKVDSLLHGEDLVGQLAAFEALLLGDECDDEEIDEGVESETDSGNETISSETVNGQSDVEEFIASMAIPPPPRLPLRMACSLIEDDYLQLVTPPPPVPSSQTGNTRSGVVLRKPKVPPPPPPRRSSLHSSSSLEGSTPTTPVPPGTSPFRETWHGDLTPSELKDLWQTDASISQAEGSMSPDILLQSLLMSSDMQRSSSSSSNLSVIHQEDS